MSSTEILELNPDDAYIELYKVLKTQGWVGSGSDAKYLISIGEVSVNQQVETRKRCKIVAGDHVVFQQEAVLIKAASPDAVAPPKAAKPDKPKKPKARPSLKF